MISMAGEPSGLRSAYAPDDTGASASGPNAKVLATLARLLGAVADARTEAFALESVLFDARAALDKLPFAPRIDKSRARLVRALWRLSKAAAAFWETSAAVSALAEFRTVELGAVAGEADAFAQLVAIGVATSSDLAGYARRLLQLYSDVESLAEEIRGSGASFDVELRDEEGVLSCRCSLADFIAANVDTLDDDDIRALHALDPCQEMTFGGGAAPFVTVRRMP